MLVHRMNLVSFRLFRKYSGNLREFFGQIVQRPTISPLPPLKRPVRLRLSYQLHVVTSSKTSDYTEFFSKTWVPRPQTSLKGKGLHPYFIEAVLSIAPYQLPVN